MANSSITTSSANKKEMWEELLFKDTVVNSYFMPRLAAQATNDFVEKGWDFSSSPNDILYIEEDLNGSGREGSKKGSEVNFMYIPSLDPRTNRGVTSGQTLEGKEVALSDYNMSLELLRYRQAVSAAGEIDWQRAAFDFPKAARGTLLQWGANMIDLLCIEALSADPKDYFYKTNDAATTVTSNATLATVKAAVSAAESKLSLNFLSNIKVWAQTGGDRTIPPIRPVMVDGRAMYVYLTHPHALYDLKASSEWRQAQREAAERGATNPLFKNAVAVWDDIIIHAHEYVPQLDDLASATVHGCYGHLLGAQSLLWAWGQKPSIVEQYKDYKENLYYAWRMTCKAGVPTFNSLVHGSMTVITTATDVSGE